MTQKLNREERALQKLIFDTVRDCAVDFMHYDRKNGEGLTEHDLVEAFGMGIVTVRQVAHTFATAVLTTLDPGDAYTPEIVDAILRGGE